jgi:soluble lytic murein transglycosylase-like protein
MLWKLVRTIPLLVLFTVNAAAQVRNTEEAGLHERAQRLEPYITQSAERYGVDASILRTICFLESRYRLEVISSKGARGPMQFMPETAQRYGLKNPHDPREATEAAARYLRDLLKRFGGRLDLALAAYNAGEGTVESFLTGRTLVLPSGKVINPRKLVTSGIPPYRETRDYVKLGLALVARGGSAGMMASGVPNVQRKSQPRSRNRDFTIDVIHVAEPATINTQLNLSCFIAVQ